MFLFIHGILAKALEGRRNSSFQCYSKSIIYKETKRLFTQNYNISSIFKAKLGVSGVVFISGFLNVHI